MVGAAPEFNFRDGLYFAAELIIGIVSISLNSLVVAAIVRTPGLHTVTNILICNLAAADICVGLFVTPSAIASFYGFPADFYGCVLLNCILLIFTNISNIQLLVIALDRFFAIKSPYHYHQLMNIRNACYINVIVWLAGTNLGLIALYGWHCPYKELTFCRFTSVIPMELMVYLQFLTIVLPSQLIMFAIYTYIFFVVRRHAKLIADLNLRFASEEEIKNAKKAYKNDLKAAKLIVLAVAVFICRTPLNILNSISLFCITCKYPYIVLLCSIILDHSNSCWNPFLYAASSTPIKTVIKHMLRSCLCNDQENICPWNVPSLQSIERSFEKSNEQERPMSVGLQTENLSKVNQTGYLDMGIIY